MSALPGALLELERGLEELLSALEGAPELEAHGSARVEAAFAHVRGELERAPEQRDGCEERLARCLRLYAVALEHLDGLRAALVRERGVCTQARTRLAHLHAGSPSGASCDLSA
jgi:hypothetical protein